MLISLSVLIRFAAIELQISLKRSSGQTFLAILEVRGVVVIAMDYTDIARDINDFAVCNSTYIYKDTKPRLNHQRRRE